MLDELQKLQDLYDRGRATKQEVDDARRRLAESGQEPKSKVGIIVGVIVALSGTIGTTIFAYVQQQAARREAEQAQRSALTAAQAQTDIAKLVAAIAIYQAKHQKLPASLSELVPTESPNIPRDPWGHEYRYRADPAQAKWITSAGPDGLFGSADDITGG